MFEYTENILRQIEKIAASQEAAITKGSEWMAETIIRDTIIHTFGTGHSHMIGLELFTRAGGLANVNAILDSTVLSFEGARRGAEIERIPGIAAAVWDQYSFHNGDLMIIISNSGRNAMPVEMAMKASAVGLRTIGIGSLEQTNQYPSRHSSGKKLVELVDLFIDNCVPSGDVSMDVGGYKTGPLSTISGVFIVNLMMTEACKIAHERGSLLPIYFSQNIDGYSNEALYKKFETRVKHL